MTRPLLVAAALAVTVTLAAGDARANPVDAFGIGSRAPALGGAVTADSEDSSASYYNPAGLVRGKDLRLDFGYRFAEPLLNMNGRKMSVDSARGFYFGLVAPGSIGKFRFAFGVMISIPDQRMVRIRSVAFETPRFIYYDNRPQRMFLSANLAIQIIPGLYIGGGITFMSRTQGDVYLKGNIAVTDPDESALVSRIDVGLFAVRYPQAGIRWDASKNLSFGVSYRHSFLLELNQFFRVDGNVGNPGMKPIIENGFLATRAIASDMFQPWQLNFGMSGRMTRRLRVNFDLTFARWSDFADTHIVTLDLDIKAFNNAVNLPGPRTYPKPAFRDVFLPRAGVELRAVESEKVLVDVRAGYSYEPSPVPDQFGESNLADSDKHTFSLGVGVELGHLGKGLAGSLSFDVHGALTYLPLRRTLKTDPLDRVGDFTADGLVPQFGLSMRTRF